MLLNVLYENFPEYVTVQGIQYPIETDFREWIRFAELIEDESVPWQVKLNFVFGWFLEEVPNDLEAAIYALGYFLTARKLYSGTEQRNTEKVIKPAFSFQEDAGCIYSAFIECYDIDLQTVEYMHWWKFKTLFDWLPEDTEIKQRIRYRTTDINSIKDKDERKRVKKIQDAIALNKKTYYLDDFDIGDVFA